MLKRIAITGPECTGKTWLSKRLALSYNTSWVPEYAVEYMQENGTDYHLEDILNIARGQLSRENKIAEKTDGILFCDTDLLVNKVWSKVVFGQIPDWINQMFMEHQYNLYLLCSPDIVWQAGAFRENPDDRDKLFEKYEEELLKHRLNYKIIQGDGDKRFQLAVNYINELFPL